MNGARFAAPSSVQRVVRNAKRRYAPSSHAAAQSICSMGKNLKNKSFLVLFFKKELLLLLAETNTSARPAPHCRYAVPRYFCTTSVR
jgi:hypothetical protein